MHYFIAWLCNNYLFRHLRTYLLTYLFSCLFVRFVICLFIYLFISLFPSFFLSLFIFLFILDTPQFVVRGRVSILDLPPPPSDSTPTGEELWEALKRDPVDKQRVKSLLESRAPVNFREPGSPQVSYKKVRKLSLALLQQ